MVDASHMNDVQNEIAAIEAALGLNPGGGAADLATRVTNLETGKATSTHDHTNRLDAVGHDVTARHAFGAALGTPVAPSTWALGVSASAGTGTRPAREDHIHGAPSDISGLIIPPGSILAYGGSSAPSGWLLCNGTAYATTAYPALYAAIGHSYGGSGGTFNVPDLRGRTVVGAGAGTGLTNRALNGSGGAETVTLGLTQLPVHAHGGYTVDPGYADHSHDYTHNHTINHDHYLGVPANPGDGDEQGWPAHNTSATVRTSDRPSYAAVYGLVRNDGLTSATRTGSTGGAAGEAEHSHGIANAGANVAHENMPPYRVAQYIIKV